MNEQNGSADLIDLAADIVSAYVSNNTVPANDLPALIADVHLRAEQHPDGSAAARAGAAEAGGKPQEVGLPRLHRLPRRRQEVQIAEAPPAHTTTTCRRKNTGRSGAWPPTIRWSRRTMPLPARRSPRRWAWASSAAASPDSLAEYRSSENQPPGAPLPAVLLFAAPGAPVIEPAALRQIGLPQRDVAVEIVGPVAGAAAVALGPECPGQAGEDPPAPGDTVVGDLVRADRQDARQMPLAHIACDAGRRDGPDCCSRARPEQRRVFPFVRFHRPGPPQCVGASVVPPAEAGITRPLILADEKAAKVIPVAANTHRLTEEYFPIAGGAFDDFAGGNRGERNPEGKRTEGVRSDDCFRRIAGRIGVRHRPFGAACAGPRRREGRLRAPGRDLPVPRSAGSQLFRRRPLLRAT